MAGANAGLYIPRGGADTPRVRLPHPPPARDDRKLASNSYYLKDL